VGPHRRITVKTSRGSHANAAAVAADPEDADLKQMFETAALRLGHAR